MHVQVPTVRLAALLGRGSLRVAALAAASIAAATVVVAVLEQAAQIPDASAVYLVAVVIVAALDDIPAHADDPQRHRPPPCWLLSWYRICFVANTLVCRPHDIFHSISP
jgi:hypothetical protein